MSGSSGDTRQDPAARAPDITVILATRNRAAHLGRALSHLAAQDTGGAFAYDVLVVDNGSADDTRRVVEERRGDGAMELRYAFEPRAGKPYALNTGMAQARGAIFAFTDDDTRPAPTWLRELWTCLCEERADAVAGRVLPRWVAGRPDWLTDEAIGELGALGLVDHGALRRHSARRQDCRWVGSNLAIRRTAALDLGPYDVRLARGQDTEYYRRAVSRALAVVYEPGAVVYHEIPPERLTADYFRGWYGRAGTSRALAGPWERAQLATIMPVWRYRRIARSAAQWVGHTLRRDPWWRRFRCELLLREDLSAWRQCLRLWPRRWLAALTGRPFVPGR